MDMTNSSFQSEQSPKTPIFGAVNDQYQKFIDQAKKNPQLTDSIKKIEVKWQLYGYKIKLALTIFVILIIITIGLRFGINLAQIFRPKSAAPISIPDVTPTPTTQVRSDLL